MLSIEGLEVGYGRFQVIWGVDLEVRSGEIVALVGSNGAGKSTLLRTISGLLRPTAGQITFQGERFDGVGSDRVVASGIIHVPEGRRLFAGMSVEENLVVGAFMRRSRKAEVRQDLDRMYALFPVLGERRRQPAGYLSGGEQQMCAIARGLMGHPSLLMVDEASLGLAPVIVESLIARLAQIRDEGTTILMVEQDVQLALETADRAYVLEAGRVVLSGPSAEVLADPRIATAYLGL